MTTARSWAGRWPASRASVVVVCLAVLVASLPALGEGPVLGPAEHQVSAFDDAQDQRPAVAPQPGGGFATVYRSRTDPVVGLRLRLLDAAGLPVGAEIPVPSEPGYGSSEGRIDSLPDGRFVVAWHEKSRQPPYPGYIRLRRFDSAGLGLGEESYLGVNDFAPGVDAAMRVDGGSVAVWQESVDIATRALDADGELGGEWAAVNERDPESPNVVAEAARVARGEDGSFLVVWRRRRWDLVTSFVDHRARPLSPQGEPLAHEVVVRPRDIGSVGDPDVAALPGGRFVVVWSEYLFQGPDPYSVGIRARRVAADGAPVGPAFQVNAYITGAQISPSVAANAAGSFVVTWEDGGRYIPGFDGSVTARGRAFLSGTTPFGEDLQLNTYTTGFQGDVRVAAGADGRFLAVWRSEASFEGDPLGGVQARTIDLPAELFRDGFEDGDVGAWTWSRP